MDHEVAHAGQGSELLLAERAVDVDLNAAHAFAAKRRNLFDRDELTAANDAHAVGDSLDLREGVARQKYCAAVVGDLAHHRPELVLHERVEPGIGFVENQ